MSNSDGPDQSVRLGSDQSLSFVSMVFIDSLNVQQSP